ncbi:hypothetical protein CAPTEDRAFT_186495 [Capitella teleta]|uniref:Uncharacterized protein n=1 Tax=Capitella teleta TaxID=283909 RepID=R7V2P5_CAPTE|nr:hypothetical protein CAPTEDRAFT_186495 [Capitella teleta]|eukprot:ELU12814.1 hypothetical protein CAPTEDRAFT_186495 [Capitella teleta]
MSISSQMAREKAELAALLVEHSKSRELMELSRQQRELEDRQQMLQLEMRIGAAQARQAVLEDCDRLKSWFGEGQIRVEHYPTKEEVVRRTSAGVQGSARSSTSSKMSISSQMAREKAELAALLVEHSKSRELMELSRQQRELEDRQQMLQLEMRIGAAQARQAVLEDCGQDSVSSVNFDHAPLSTLNPAAQPFSPPPTSPLSPCPFTSPISVPVAAPAHNVYEAIVTALSMPQPELTPFSGDYLEFPSFISSFDFRMQKATRLQLGSVNMKIDGPMSHTQKFNMAMTISSILADVVADCGQATFQTRMTFLARVLAMFKLGRSEEENEQRHQVSLGEADDEAVPEQMLIGESEVRHEVMSEDVVESSGNALRCQVVSQDGVLVGDVVLESGVIDDADDVSAPPKKRVFVEVDAAWLLKGRENWLKMDFESFFDAPKMIPMPGPHKKYHR